MRSDNLQLACVQPPTSSYNVQLDCVPPTTLEIQKTNQIRRLRISITEEQGKVVSALNEVNCGVSDHHF